MLSKIKAILGLLSNIYRIIFLSTTEIAGISQSSPVTNTWYTVLDSTEQGILRHVRMYNGSAGINPDDLEMRITRDGAEKVYAPTIVSSIFNGVDLDSTIFGISFVDFYNTSIKIEVRVTIAAASNLEAYAIRSVI